MGKWVNADKTYPERMQVVLLRRIGETDEKFALWDGESYYIFNILRCEWKTWDWFYRDGLTEISDFEWSYAKKDAYRTRSFYALAEAKRSAIG